jgi:hypothetical protein
MKEIKKEEEERIDFKYDIFMLLLLYFRRKKNANKTKT